MLPIRMLWCDAGVEGFEQPSGQLECIVSTAGTHNTILMGSCYVGDGGMLTCLLVLIAFGPAVLSHTVSGSPA